MSGCENVFQSTPSVWKVTLHMRQNIALKPFQSTPSVWKVTSCFLKASVARLLISIHTFRVEGDLTEQKAIKATLAFQSTPSVWKVTFNVQYCCAALAGFQSTPSVWKVTKVDGDMSSRRLYFNPHLPCGR